MNGLPLIQVELKKRGVAIREAFNQINRYSKESFNSDNSLYKYLQIFVISNGTDSRYFANTTKRNKNSFDFTMNWAKADNTLIKDLKDFTATFFQKNTNRSACSQDCAFGRDRACGCADFRFQSADFCGDRCDFGYEPHMERLTEGKSDAGCRYFSRISDRMRFCTLAAVAAAVLSVDGSRHALRHHTLYRAAAEFCHSAREHCVRGCLSVYGRRRRGLRLSSLHRYDGRSGGCARGQYRDPAIQQPPENPEYDVRAAKAVSPASGGACDRAPLPGSCAAAQQNGEAGR